MLHLRVMYKEKDWENVGLKNSNSIFYKAQKKKKTNNI